MERYYRIARGSILCLIVVLCSEITWSQSSRGIDTTTFSSKRFTKAVVFTAGYYATSLVVLGNTWYKDQQRVPFHFRNDISGYQQVDKFGHTFGSYFYSSLGYYHLRSRGVSKNESLLYGGSLGFVLQAPIEIMDGFYKGYGFSWSDILANSLGSGLLIGQELLFDEQIVRMKFGYWPSEYASVSNRMYGKTIAHQMLKDYNAQTYWFSVPLGRITGNNKMPSWLCLSFGYGANGMLGESSNLNSFNGVALPNVERYRQYYLSLDVDWSRIRTRSKLLKSIFVGLNYVKIPLPAIEYSSKRAIRFHWLFS